VLVVVLRCTTVPTLSSTVRFGTTAPAAVRSVPVIVPVGTIVIGCA
jgi:hypothetical protein